MHVDLYKGDYAHSQHIWYILFTCATMLEYSSTRSDLQCVQMHGLCIQYKLFYCMYFRGWEWLCQECLMERFHCVYCVSWPLYSAQLYLGSWSFGRQVATTVYICHSIQVSIIQGVQPCKTGRHTSCLIRDYSWVFIGPASLIDKGHCWRPCMKVFRNHLRVQWSSLTHMQSLSWLIYRWAI